MTPMPGDQLNRVPELLALADQREQVARLRARDPDEDALAKIEHGLSLRFWGLAYAIAASLPRIG